MSLTHNITGSEAFLSRNDRWVAGMVSAFKSARVKNATGDAIMLRLSLSLAGIALAAFAMGVR